MRLAMIACLSFLSLSSAATGGAEYNESIKLVPSDAGFNDFFGTSIACGGEAVLVGAPHGSPFGDPAGAAYLFDRATGTERYKLVANVGSPTKNFGASVKTDGIHALVAGSGETTVFDVATGLELGKLKLPIAGASDVLGLAVGGGRALVRGDPLVPTSFGATVHLLDVSTGQHLVEFTRTDGFPADGFGWNAAMEGNTVLIGAVYDDDLGPESGSAYLFDATTGLQIAKLLAPDGAANDWFGHSIDLHGGIAIVGAAKDDDQGFDSGSAYLFDASTGLPIGKLVPDVDVPAKNFGVSVALHGSTAIIGSTSNTAYVFDVKTRKQTARLVASDHDTHGWFGVDVATNGASFVVGARFKGESYSGAAYIFTSSVNDYGAGCPGLGGFTPTLDFSGVLAAGEQVSLTIAGGLGGAPALTMIGVAGAATSIGGGCTLLVAPTAPVAPLLLGGAGPGGGTAVLSAILPASALLAPLHVQTFVADTASPTGFSATGGLRVIIV